MAVSDSREDLFEKLGCFDKGGHKIFESKGLQLAQELAPREIQEVEHAKFQFTDHGRIFDFFVELPVAASQRRSWRPQHVSCLVELPFLSWTLALPAALRTYYAELGYHKLYRIRQYRCPALC